MKYLKLKQELKKAAIEIRKLKGDRKPSPNGYVPYLYAKQWHYRHEHIVYCLLRGRTIEEIENKVREGNEPDEKLLERYMDQYKEEALCEQETLCACR